MRRTCRRPRHLGAGLAALTAAITLAGCLKLDGELTVHGDDTVSGTYVVAVDRQLLSITGQDADSLTEQIQAGLEEDAPEEGQFSSEPYEDDRFVGATVRFSGVPLAEFDAPGTDDEDSSFVITHDGDEYRVTGQFAVDTGDLGGGVAGVDVSSLLEENPPEIRLAITFPGRVTEANGDIDGCTVSWEPSFTETTQLEATANDSGGCTRGLSWWAWIVIGLGVVVMAGAVVAIVRTVRDERQRHGAGRPPTPLASGGDDRPPGSSPPPSPTLPPPAATPGGGYPPPAPRPESVFPPPDAPV